MSVTFLLGDCLEIMPTLPDKSVDCFVCDLPYGCLTGGGISNPETAKRFNNNKGTTITGCSWDIKINLAEFWTQVKRLAKNDHTPVLMFCTTKFGYELIKSNESWFRYDLVWDKRRGVSFLSANKMPMRSHEMIYVFSKKGAYYKRVDIKGDFQPYVTCGGLSRQYGTVITGGKPGGDGTRCVLSVIPSTCSTKAGKHPTEKSKELYRWLLERYCPEGGTVLDPTAGSFNSCFAAQELGLHAIGIEKDEGFYKQTVPSEDIIQHV